MAKLKLEATAKVKGSAALIGLNHKRDKKTTMRKCKALFTMSDLVKNEIALAK
jgi:hypothetical protein